MKIKDVPQDENKIYEGFTRKAIYAEDENGKYKAVPYSGWEVEEIVLRDVIQDFNDDAEEAKQRFLSNEASPLEYFMYKNMMDLAALSSSIGFSKRKLKKHMKPEIFSRLDEKTLKKYADLFRTDVRALKTLKEN